MAKKNPNIIKAIDLFCGGGGTSTGLAKAAELLKKKVELIAVNHWDVAIATHSINHKAAKHFCTGIDSLDPRKLVPGGRLDLLVASPECTHHSRARGGKPMSDQSRSSGWHILRFAEALYIDNIIIENVREFVEWSPLDASGRPMKSKKGQLFQQFINSFRALGYNVEYRVLTCADYGDPTTRERLFIIARRGNKKIVWPKPTHAPAAELAKPSLFENNLKPWRTARECIDWSMESQSIFNRSKSLADNTLTRIEAGLKKFNGIEVDLKRCVRENLRPYVCVVQNNDGTPSMTPFIGVLRNHGDANSTEAPLPAITAGGMHFGVVQPYMVTAGGTKGQGRNPHSVNEPLGAVLTNDRRALVESAFVLQTDQVGGMKDGKKGGGTAVRSVDQPIPTLVTKANTCLVEPFLSHFRGDHSGREDGATRNGSLSDPLPTQDSSNRFGLVEPFILPHPHKKDQPHSVERPMRTITATSSDLSLCEPFLLGQQSCAAPRSVKEPVPTVAGAGAISLTESFLVPNFGEREGQAARCQSVDSPMPTVTASKGAGNLVTPHLVPKPFIAPTNHGAGDTRRTASLDEPMKTVTGSLGDGLVEPQFIIEYYGSQNMSGVDEPMKTVTGTDRFALVDVKIVARYMLDIRFRMLQPKELAAGNGFPANYVFTGSKKDQVKQIGNAVPPGTAMALALSCLSEDSASNNLREAA